MKKPNLLQENICAEFVALLARKQCFRATSLLASKQCHNMRQLPVSPAFAQTDP